ncbi:MAG: SusC/RagA family TonB-linked outer membrane protein [Mangrovibacterium sp.]
MKKKLLTDTCYRSGIRRLLKIMKLTAFLLFLSFLQLSASTYSQNTRFSLSLKEASLREVVEEIEKQSEFRFLFRDNTIDSKQHVTINMSGTVEEILKELFKDYKMSYQILENNLIVISNASTASIQQQKNVSGIVTDSSGAPLPGVSVVIKGTTQGTITNDEGKYSLPNVPADATLIFSFVGMKSQEIRIAGKTTINVDLEEEMVGLEEVVAVGYGVQKKSDITGAVASYNAKQLERMPQTNIAQALQGKIAGMGVTSTSSSAEDGGTKILIRGSRSISASNSPLIILDGIPYSSPFTLSEVNPNDIESIEILKDASSTAIYGARAANGVILVTSKKGQRGKATVKLDSYYGVDQIAKRPRYFTADEYWKAVNEREGMADKPTAEEEANREAGRSTDWQKIATRNGVRQQHNISVSGASETLTYYLSGAWSNTKGITLGDEFSRTTIRINLEGKVTKWLSIGTNTQLGYINRDGVPVNYHFDTANAPSPYTLAYNEDGSLKIFPEPKTFGLAAYGNMLDPLLYENRDVTRSVITNNYAIIDFPFIPGLSYRINTGVTYRNRSNEIYRPSTSAAGYADKGRGDVEERNYEDWIIDNIISYNRTFGKHTISLTGLYSAQKNTNILHTKRGQGFPNDFQGVYGISSATTITSSESFVESSFLSQMGRINYNYDSRYLLTATVRRDGFSGFGPENKTGIFPSVALGWNFSEEGFIRKLEWLSIGKLRISYGVNGNQAIDSYETLPSLSGLWYLDAGKLSAVGYYPSALGDPSLGWETTKSVNLGLDYGVFQGRISGSLDVFKSKTTDLLLNRVISPVNGTTTIKQNVGSTENFGYEVQLSTTNIGKKDFTWTTNVNLSYSKNKIVDVGVYDENGNTISDVGNRWFIGKPINVLYNYKFDHILQEGETPPVSQATAKPGYALVHNLNDEGSSKDKIDADDMTIIGYADPFYYAGLTNTITYKNLSLTFFLNGQFGKTGNGDYNYWVNYNTLYKEFWTPETPDVVFPSNSANSNPYVVRVWDKRNKANFVKIQDVTLSYTVPSSVTKRWSVSHLEFYCNAKNLHSFTNWAWGPDPEFSDQRGNPSITSILFGTKVTF